MLAKNDPRLPHLALKIDKQIHKTALDAERQVKWRRTDDVFALIDQLKKDDFTVAAIEQSPSSVKLPDYKPDTKIALLVGREVEGVEPEVLAACDKIIEIPMFGNKESFNVVQAAAMGLYHCRFM
jgi:tRNA G18 (ribose-2'-O)-methylase SpoU